MVLGEQKTNTFSCPGKHSSLHSQSSAAPLADGYVFLIASLRRSAVTKCCQQGRFGMTSSSVCCTFVVELFHIRYKLTHWSAPLMNAVWAGVHSRYFNLSKCLRKRNILCCRGLRRNHSKCYDFDGRSIRATAQRANRSECHSRAMVPFV